MKSSIRSFQAVVRFFVEEDSGQDLVEYAAVIMIVVLGLTAGMSTLAGGINNAMTTVSSAINATLA